MLNHITDCETNDNVDDDDDNGDDEEEENSDPRLTIWTVPEVPVAFRVAPPAAAQALATRKMFTKTNMEFQPRKSGM